MARFALILTLAAQSVLGSNPAPATAADSTAELKTRLEHIERELDLLPKLLPSLQTHQRIGFHGHQADPAWVRIDFGRQVTPERIVIFPARPTVAEGVPSPGFPSEFDIEISDTAAFANNVRIAHWKEPEPGVGEHTTMLSFPGNGASGRYLRVRVSGFRDDPQQPGQRYFRLGEIVVLEDGQNAALDRRVSSTASTESSRRWEARNLTDGYFWCLPLRGAMPSPTNGYHSTVTDSAVTAGKTWVEVDLGTKQQIDEIHLVPARPRDFADLPGFGFPTQFELLADPNSPDEKTVLREVEPPHRGGEALPNPGSAQLMTATPGLVARRIRISCEVLWRRGPGSGVYPSEYIFAMSELQAWREGKNIAAGCPVQCANSIEESGWSPAALTDGYSSRHNLLDWSTWLDEFEQSELLRAESLSIRNELQQRRDARRHQLLTGAIASTIVIAFLATGAVLILRVRAARAQEELRARIARDLHDEIGASLSQLAIQSDLAQVHLSRGELQGDRLAAISDTARQTLDHMRDVIWLLVPKASNWAELSHRLQSITSRILDGVEHDIQVDGQPPEGKPPIEWSRNVVTILKESLTNIRKHSSASHVRVVITWGKKLELLIQDNGRGFDVDVAQHAKGFGLNNLQQRARQLNAALEICSKPGNGTRVSVSAPIPTA